jgi:precorrin-8X/cobalt-precorrin-8 methylmutase
MMQPDEIQRESFRIIEAEVGPHHLSPEQWLVTRRVIHTTGDFEYAQLLRFHPAAFAAATAAIGAGEDILTDVQMVRMGIQPLAARRHGLQVRCHLGDVAIGEAIKAQASTRTARGILQGLAAGRVGMCVIGNAPTAVRALLAALQETDVEPPRLIIGVPVGFVDAAESKRALANTETVPWITCEGRKGGSTVAAAIVNALLEWVSPHRAPSETSHG